MRPQGAELLEAAGWTPDRQVRADADVAALRSEGFEVWPAAAEFLRSHRGISINWPHHPRLPLMWFDGAKAAAQADLDWIQDYAQRVGEDLVPVGYASSNHAVVMLSRGGHLYGAFDDELWALGDSVAEALDITMQPALGD